MTMLSQWALIRDYDMPTLEATAGLDDKNPMVHVPNSIDRLPSTPEADPTANPLAIELISMASVLSNIEHPPEVRLVDPLAERRSSPRGC